MKKLTYLALAAMAVLCSCSNSDIDDSNNGAMTPQGVTEFTATIEGDDGATRTAYDVTNRYATWIANTDQISINGYTYKAKETGSTTAFTSIGEEAPTADTYKAYYPATMYSSDAISLPASYSYTSNSPFNMPMYAESSSTELSFKNLTGVIALTVPSSEMANIKTITVTSDMAISGTCTISYADDAPTVTMTGTADADKTVTIDCGEGVDNQSGSTFYIPVPAGSHSLIFAVSDGTHTKYMASKNASGISIARKNIYSLTFTENAVQLWAGGPKWATMNVGATTTTEYGGYYCWGKTTNLDSTGEYSTSTSDISGTDEDTAKNLWGNSWKMPTYTDFCNILSSSYTDGRYWVTNYNDSGINGFLVKGKAGTVYESNEVFFPAAGYSCGGSVVDAGSFGAYRSSTPRYESTAYIMSFSSNGNRSVGSYNKSDCCSVRAVLAY